MPYPPNDGGAIATLNMIKGFLDKGDNISVLTMKTHKHSFSIKNLPTEIKKSISWYQVDVDTEISPLKAIFNLLFSSKPYNAVRFESRKFKKELEWLLKNNSYDIIQLEGLYLNSYTQTIRNNSNAKIVLRAHNIEYEIWERLAENESSRLKGIYLKIISNRIKRLELDFLKQIDLLVPISSRDAQVINKKDKTFISPTGIEEDKFKFTTPKYNKSIFYIGALDWVPNQEALIWFLKNIWTDVSSRFADWEFIVAGRNASSKFEEDIKRYDIKYIGEVDSAIEFIDEHNIMVVPLLSGSGMRIKIIEGMARGKCILTTSIGVEGIDAENGQEIFIQDSIVDSKEILIDIMQNTDKIEACRKKAYTFVKEKYNNKKIIDSLRNFYLKNI
jgi:glycosyltransferase involved in cell wall biosynthesis